MTATFHVPDMTCKHCEGNVRGALEKDLPGAAFTIDLAARQVTVEGEAARVEDILREAGFTPEAVAD